MSGSPCATPWRRTTWLTCWTSWPTSARTTPTTAAARTGWGSPPSNGSAGPTSFATRPSGSSGRRARKAKPDRSGSVADDRHSPQPLAHGAHLRGVPARLVLAHQVGDEPGPLLGAHRRQVLGAERVGGHPLPLQVLRPGAAGGD